jgi:hypothetical protein
MCLAVVSQDLQSINPVEDMILTCRDCFDVTGNNLRAIIFFYVFIFLNEGDLFRRSDVFFAVFQR